MNQIYGLWRLDENRPKKFRHFETEHLKICLKLGKRVDASGVGTLRGYAVDKGVALEGALVEK